MTHTHSTGTVQLCILAHLHITTTGTCGSADASRPLAILSITCNIRMTDDNGGRPFLGHALKCRRVILRVWLERWREEEGGKEKETLDTR